MKIKGPFHDPMEQFMAGRGTVWLGEYVSKDVLLLVNVVD